MTAGDLQSFINEVQEDLQKFLEEQHDDPIRSDRLAQIARAKKANLYWQGKQYLTPKFNSESLTIDWVPIQTDRKGKKVFCRVDNIILGDGIKFAALVGQRKLNQRCVPEDPDDETKVEASRNAGTMGKYLHRYWHFQNRINTELAQPNWTSGPVYAFVEYETNALKHGTHEEPNIVPKPTVMPGTVVCSACGYEGNPEGSPACAKCGAPLDPSNTVPGPEVVVPEQDGVTSYDRGMPELELYDCLYVTTPFKAKKLEDCGWLDLSQIITARMARAEMRRMRVKATLTGEEEESVRAAHDALMEIASPSASNQGNDKQEEYVWSQRWLRPSEYELMDKECREAFQKRFPSGVRLHRMGAKLVFCEESAMDDHWRVCKSGMDSYINAPGMCDSSMSFQDSWNDFWNMVAESLMRNVPKHLIDSQLIDAQWLRDNPDAQVADVLFTRMKGVDLSKATATLPSTRFPAEIPQVASQMRQGIREINGIQQALFGANEGSQTWREANQKKNQAMAQFQPNYDNYQEFGAGVTEIGVKLAAKHGFGKILLSPEGSTGLETVEEVDLAELNGTGWHFEAEEVIPQTTGEMKEAMAGLATEAPQIAQGTGMFHIMNAGRMQTLFGDPSMYVPGEYERWMVMERIQELLAAQPITNMAPDPMNPMMMAPKESSSIPPDEVTDKDHELVATILRVWLIAPAGRKAAKKNPMGYANVRLHCLEQDQAAMAAMMPPPGAPPAPGDPAAEPAGGPTLGAPPAALSAPPPGLPVQ